MSVKKKFKKLRELTEFENPVELFCGLVFFKKTRALTYRYKGLRVFVDHAAGDQDGVRACLVPGLYEAFFDEMDALLKGPPLHVVDLGANTGGFIMALLARGARVQRGICVELNPATSSRLSLNLSQNGLLQQVEVVNAAIAGEDGTLEVNLTGGSVGDSIYQPKDKTKDLKLQTVRALTVNTLLAQWSPELKEVSLCKIDIEGAEYESLLKGAASSLSKCRWVIIELHPDKRHQEQEIHAHFEKAGFQLLTPSQKPIEDQVFLYQNKNFQ